LILLAAIAVVLESGLPVFYHETRLGLHRSPFSIIKVRTLQPSTSDGCSIAIEEDPRITKSGRWLRRLRLDELPQLFLVITGKMNLIGPRPLQPVHLEALPPEQCSQLLSVKPGIIGAGALEFISDDIALRDWQQVNPTLSYQEIEKLYITKILPRKVEADCAYFHNSDPLKAYTLLFRTLASFCSVHHREKSRQRVLDILNSVSAVDTEID
jgi:lipopolysaccharide/colanic/teichoic acid biosynthesis glycosyltransferase